MPPPPAPAPRVKTVTLTDKEIDERVSFVVIDHGWVSHLILKIARAVEAEVTRRLEERERERALEDEARREEARQQAEEESSRAAQKRRERPPPHGSIPSGTLSPLLRRHEDLDGELKKRLEELEQKLWVLWNSGHSHQAHR